ncbi:MAG TPA: glycosyltransferase family 2 protein [Opitutales bacterium]|nr:glycosyltransferase family 2 protein [Opitutales bacterium]
MTAPAKVPVSVLIPVKNEAANLPRCLAAVNWAAEIFVVDSQSTDGTPGIAQGLGAKVVQFQYHGGWPKKKEWSLRRLPFAHDWVLLLDADEVMPAESAEEIRAIVTKAAEGPAGYWINRRFFFLGQWLRHAYFPNWNLRLVRHQQAHFEKLAEGDTRSGDNEVHEHLLVEGSTGRLRAMMDHYAFPTIDAFVEKHNRYSNWEATVALESAGAQNAAQLQKAEVGWRRRLKGVARKLPCRPTLRFLYVYLWQRGFLDGRAGWYFARLHAYYEFLTVAKTYELRQQRDRGLK